MGLRTRRWLGLSILALALLVGFVHAALCYAYSPDGAPYRRIEPGFTYGFVLGFALGSALAPPDFFNRGIGRAWRDAWDWLSPASTMTAVRIRYALLAGLTALAITLQWIPMVTAG
jgi:hypothetical protein